MPFLSSIAFILEYYIDIALLLPLFRLVIMHYLFAQQFTRNLQYFPSYNNVRIYVEYYENDYT